MSVLGIDKSFMPIQQDMMVKPLTEEKEAAADKKANNPAEKQLTAGSNGEQQLEEAVEQINNTVGSYRTELEFSIHKESGKVSVKVIDKRDNSVIREIPSERALKFAAYVKKMLGLMFDEFI